MAADGDGTLERLDAITASLAAVAAAVEQQRDDIRAALEVLVQLADAVVHPPSTAVAPTNGVEVGALMGATQAAWLRLEQRLEGEFADIHRELRSLSSLTDAGTTPAIATPTRPVVSSDQLRRAASSLRESVRGLRRPRA